MSKYGTKYIHASCQKCLRCRKCRRTGLKKLIDYSEIAGNGTLDTILYEHGHLDSSVVPRTSHRDLNSLKNYQHLRGPTGLAQQRHFAVSNEGRLAKSMFDCSGSGESKRRMKMDSSVAYLDSSK